LLINSQEDYGPELPFRCILTGETNSPRTPGMEKKKKQSPD